MAYRKRRGFRKSFKRRFGFRKKRRGGRLRAVIKRAIAKANKWTRGKSRSRLKRAYLAKVGKSKYNRIKR